MDTGNETASRECRFLSEAHFDELFAVFTEAFSDYVFPFALTETQFRNHLNLNGVDLERTAGCFVNGRLVGFSLNGFGNWEGSETVYDAGTGVIPSARRQGASEAMFEMMLPRFKAAGISQCLLEVISSNTGAIRLYEKLGFCSLRRLLLLQCDSEIEPDRFVPDGIEIRPIEKPDWTVLQTFWDAAPSWQNSTHAVGRSLALKNFIGAFENGVCVGYAVFSKNFGRIAQMAVRPDRRGRGIGSILLDEVRRSTSRGYSLQVINIDRSLSDAIAFFNKRGFYERLEQREMLLVI